MATGSGMSLNVDDNLIKPVIEAEIHSAIVTNLMKIDDKIISQLVSQVLNQMVDSNGKPSNNRYSDDKSFLVWLLNNAIKDATKEALKNYIEDRKETLTLEIEKQLFASKSELARIFVEGITRGMSSSWSFKVDINLPNKE